MPETPLLQSPRNRFFAFSAVGVAMVCLPLWQVLHYQQSELRELAAERALLDPVAQAVHTQFGLLAHRQISAQLLQGRPQLEATRRALQAGVDEHLQTLAQELTQGLWTHALAETRDLTRDWQALARRVAARSLTAAQSDHIHTLRLEQAVQVMDLVAATETAGDSSDAVPQGNRRFAAAARLLTGLATDLTLAAPQLQPHAAPDTFSTSSISSADAAEGLQTAWQDRLQNKLSALDAAFQPGRVAHGDRANTPAASPLTAALAQVDQHTRAYLQALQIAQQPTSAAAAEGRSRDTVYTAWQKAQKAQLTLFQHALAAHKLLLARHSQQLEQQRAALLAAMGMLTALALGLAAALVQRLSPGPTPPLGPAAARRASAWHADTGAATELQAGTAEATLRGAQAMPQGSRPTPTRVATVHLMQRLRTTPAQSPADASPAPPREPQDTLPPERG